MNATTIYTLRTLLAAAAIALSPEAASAQAKLSAKRGCDSVAGAAAFKTRCAICHGVQAEGSAVGPSLKGVFGAKAATGPYDKYSQGLKAAKVTWTSANLDLWLAQPAAIAPGTGMIVAVPDPVERKNLIAYLATLKAAK